MLFLKCSVLCRGRWLSYDRGTSDLYKGPIQRGLEEMSPGVHWLGPLQCAPFWDNGTIGEKGAASFPVFWVSQLEVHPEERGLDLRVPVSLALS